MSDLSTQRSDSTKASAVHCKLCFYCFCITGVFWSNSSDSWLNKHLCLHTDLLSQWVVTIRTQQSSITRELSSTQHHQPHFFFLSHSSSFLRSSLMKLKNCLNLSFCPCSHTFLKSVKIWKSPRVQQTLISTKWYLNSVIRVDSLLRTAELIKPNIRDRHKFNWTNCCSKTCTRGVRVVIFVSTLFWCRSQFWS